MELKEFRDTYYLISRSGDVFSKKSGRFLRSDINRQGYHIITLMIDGKPRHFRKHRLVAECYIPNPDLLPDVNHKDGNKSNCNDYNLEWCTKSHNMKHAYDNGLITDADKNLRLGSNIGAMATSLKYKARKEELI